MAGVCLHVMWPTVEMSGLVEPSSALWTKSIDCGHKSFHKNVKQLYASRVESGFVNPPKKVPDKPVYPNTNMVYEAHSQYTRYRMFTTLFTVLHLHPWN